MIFNNTTRLQSRKGFTLVELMVTLAIMGILGAIVIPSYQGIIHRIARSDAQKSIDAIALRLELCFKEHFTYVFDAATAPACPDPAIARTSIDNMYNITIAPGVTNFTITATTMVNGWASGDDTCNRMMKNDRGIRTSLDTSANPTSATCWPGL